MKRFQLTLAGSNRFKLVRKIPNILQNVTPKPKLNSCLCCQTARRRCGVFVPLLSGSYTTNCTEYSQKKAEDTKSQPAARFVSVAVHCLAWVRSSGALALPLIHMDIRTSSILSVCFPACSRPKNLSPAPAKCSDIQLCVAKSAPVEKTHAENKQLVLYYHHYFSVQLDDTGAKEIATMVHAQISGFPSIPCQSHRAPSVNLAPYLAQDRNYIP